MMSWSRFRLAWAVRKSDRSGNEHTERAFANFGVWRVKIIRLRNSHTRAASRDERKILLIKCEALLTELESAKGNLPGIKTEGPGSGKKSNGLVAAARTLDALILTVRSLTDGVGGQH